ncbi:xylose isomerase [Clostridia bacterium]|nr:xylose isomerase [Clostridia bacterium]
MINLTTDPEDMKRFASRDDLDALLSGFDGLELMYLDEDARDLVAPRQVVGIHMNHFHYWVDLWNGDERALLREFGSKEAIARYYGGTECYDNGTGRDVIITRLRRDLDAAVRYGAEYVVFHISDAGMRESLTRQFQHTDEEVIRASIEVLNIVFRNVPPITLLFENLWHPGLTFLDPEMTKLLFDGVEHPDTGIMLDTGHLMMMNPALRTEEEAVAFIVSQLGRHDLPGEKSGSFCEKIRGIHLNKSLTGETFERYRVNPLALPEDQDARMAMLYEYIFQIETHLPFTGTGVRELIEQIAPDYLVYEFMSRNLKQHQDFLAAQRRSLE